MTDNFILALPEMFLLGMTCLVLLAGLFIQKKQHLITFVLSLITLFATLGITLWLFTKPDAITFNGEFVWDPVAGVLKVFILLISAFSFIYARPYIQERSIPVNEYYILGLFSTLGMLVLVSSHSFLSLFLGLEIVTLPLYAMVAIQRDLAVGYEAAMKYFVMGALASAMLLYGMSMVYGAAHSLDFNQIATTVASTPPQQQFILIFGLVFIIAGIAFKFGAAPFHMWVPDIYEGAPTSVTLFVGSAPKVAAFGMAIRLLIDAMPGDIIQWHQIFVVLAVASVVIGNVVAIVQSNLKRMLSYSAIAHIGYMLLGIVAGTAAGYAAAMFYMIVYAIMSLGAFAILALLSCKGVEVEEISDLRGLNSHNPWLAFMMLLFMFSMAGIPPTAGFFAKLGVLEALIGVNNPELAVFALVLAIIGAYYYLNVVKVMYFEEPEVHAPVAISPDLTLAISINGLAILFLGIFPSSLIHLCRSAFALLM